MMLTTLIELVGIRDKMPFEPRFAPIPFGDSHKTLLLANAMMVHMGSTDRELAVQFLQMACSPGIQVNMGKAGFLSVLHSVNEKQWSKFDLESLCIVDGVLRDTYYQHETISDLHTMFEVSNEMTLYWEGMESASQCAGRIHKMLSRSKKTM